MTTESATPRVETPAELLERAERSFDRRSYDEALRSFQLAAVGSEAAADAAERARLVRSLAGAAAVHALQGNAAEARRWLSEAENYPVREAGRAAASILFARGLVAREEARFEVAATAFAELYELALAGNLEAQAVRAAHMASVVSEGDAQIEWGRRALEAAADRPEWRGPIVANLAWLYDRADRHDEALEAFREARALAQEHEGRHGQLVAEWQLARALRRASQPVPAREVLQRALALAQDRYLVARSPNDAEWLGRCFLELAELDRFELQALRSQGEAPGDQLRTLRERGLRGARRAQRLFVEAGAVDAAPELIQEAAALEAALSAAAPSRP